MRTLEIELTQNELDSLEHFESIYKDNPYSTRFCEMVDMSKSFNDGLKKLGLWSMKPKLNKLKKLGLAQLVFDDEFIHITLADRLVESLNIEPQKLY